MNMNEAKRLDLILERFPFHRQNDQEQKLAEYTIAALGNNKSGIQERTGISQPTIRKIQSEYAQLDLEDKILLMNHLCDLIISKTDEDWF